MTPISLFLYKKAMSAPVQLFSAIQKDFITKSGSDELTNKTLINPTLTDGTYTLTMPPLTGNAVIATTNTTTTAPSNMATTDTPQELSNKTLINPSLKSIHTRTNKDDNLTETISSTFALPHSTSPSDVLIRELRIKTCSINTCSIQ